MERFLEQSFRRGVIPWCCGGASVCFAFYAVKVTRGARTWEALAAFTAANNNQSAMANHHETDDRLATRLEIEFARNEGRVLHQHAGTCAALSLTSTAITWQATKDWRRYRKLATLEQMERWLLSQGRPFFLRPSVLLTTMVSFGAVKYYFGELRLWHRPAFYHYNF